MNKTKIELKDLVFFAYHGALEEEAKLGQRFRVDVSLQLVDGLEFSSDHTDCTVNYADVFEVVKARFTDSRFNLIERAAEVVAEAILEQFERVQEVSVTVKKPAVPVDCVCEYFSVEVNRCR